MAIRAIETSYKGYRFRSRLEARWAVFFDALDIDWEYEPQGFKTPFGAYLPDFWLPDWMAWVEIKATLEGIESTAGRAHALALENGTPVLMVVGKPWPHEYQILELPGVLDERNNLDVQRYWYGIARCRRCDGYCLTDAWQGWRNIGTHACGDHDKDPLPETPRLLEAYGRARRARFEHGERPW